jgi:hypothetical protein
MNCNHAQKLLREHERNKPNDFNSNTVRALRENVRRYCGFVDIDDGEVPPAPVRADFPPIFNFKTVGSKLQVWRGNAAKTVGGLTKKDLIQNKRGKVVSKAKSDLAKKNNFLGL